MNVGDSVEKIRKYFEKEKFNFQPVRQKDGEISKAFGVRAYPTNYVLTGDRKVSARTVGFDEAAIKAALDKLAPKK